MVAEPERVVPHVEMNLCTLSPRRCDTEKMGIVLSPPSFSSEVRTAQAPRSSVVSSTSTSLHDRFVAVFTSPMKYMPRSASASAVITEANHESPASTRFDPSQGSTRRSVVAVVWP